MTMNATTVPAGAGAAYTVRRSDVWIPARGARCAAWFYEPEGVSAPPLVVMAHGLGGTRHLRLDAYARRFAQAGMAALLFDYRGFGDSEGEPRQIVNVAAQLEDWRSALAFARTSLPIDCDRVALWGTSFGGGHVLTIAAEDDTLAGVVAQCPFTDGPTSVLRRALASPLSAAALMVLGLVDAIGSRLGRAPLLVPMAGTWWMPAFLAARDSLPGAASHLQPGDRLVGRSVRWLERLPALRRRLGPVVELDDRPVASGVDTVWGVIETADGGTMTNAIAARLALTLATYRPVRRLRRTGDTPILVCACDDDTVAPVGPIVRAARRRSNVTVQHYPLHHFAIYVGEPFERAVGAQTAFLKRVLDHETGRDHRA
jgi:uncharacterized protein